METIVFDPNKEFEINGDANHDLILFSHIDIPPNCELSTCVFRFKDSDSTTFSKSGKNNSALFVNENKKSKGILGKLVIVPECHYSNDNEDKFTLHYTLK